ncbi:MAG: CBS domain-containing protein [Caldilineaceae bacterium]|nr:CBS domain-containing protein [Caldilineaceae bacterium]
MSDRVIDIILTHERTDFDALASLLGASLLFPSAQPVLPRQMNRNVRDFLALYQGSFRFIPADDLVKGVKVRRAIVVDTRAANSPKGTQPDTEYIVIDHHLPADDGDEPDTRRLLPQARELWCDSTGANTTLLVEKLIEHGIAVTPVEATLLALGIYEDTGNLTYTSTTFRDAAALAWLLEPARGVNMEEVNEFLHHPISQAQQALLQKLMDDGEFLDIEGHTVMLATALAPDFDDELSTLAARLRDFHEPDALFVVVDLGDVVQVVARSTTDDIDVGKVMRALGGGGHNRAAAAHLRDGRLATVRQQVIDLVHLYGQAANTVGEIMSSGRPQMLAPDLPVREAADLMRRWGHEGFPVVERGPAGSDILHGVLTRREADRALDHGLGDQPVSRFMRAGAHTVRPDDSVATLRRIMIETDWGQIPVVNAAGAIVGIVTRTDLIKLWDERGEYERSSSEIARRLRRALRPVQHHLLELVGEELEAMRYAGYVVGGFVRDLMLDVTSQRALTLDVDIVIEGDAISLARRMQARFGGRVVEHRRFGTAKWILASDEEPINLDGLLAGVTGGQHADIPPHLDFVTARTEFYTEPTVLPTVQQSSIKLDLHRRDFTINTLALCLNPDRWGKLLDFWGGMADLQAGLVRVLHSLSFVDDPTRILRAVRYERRFGFHIEPRTMELLRDALDLLDRVTPTRIRHELERILEEETPEKALLRLDELGILRRIYPALKMDGACALHFVRLRELLAAPDADPMLVAQPLPLLYWTLMCDSVAPADADALQQRLGLRGDTISLMRSMADLRRNLPVLADPATPPSVAVTILDASTDAALALLPVVTDDAQVLQTLAQYRATWQHVTPSFDGHALRALGVPRGGIYRTILANLRAGLLDGKISTRAEEEALVRAIAGL